MVGETPNAPGVNTQASCPNPAPAGLPGGSALACQLRAGHLAGSSALPGTARSRLPLDAVYVHQLLRPRPGRSPQPWDHPTATCSQHGPPPPNWATHPCASPPRTLPPPQLSPRSTWQETRARGILPGALPGPPRPGLGGPLPPHLLLPPGPSGSGVSPIPVPFSPSKSHHPIWFGVLERPASSLVWDLCPQPHTVSTRSPQGQWQPPPSRGHASRRQPVSGLASAGLARARVTHAHPANEGMMGKGGAAPTGL